MTEASPAPARERALDGLRERLRACRRCGHGEDVRPIVSLARRPKVVLVGQAPGAIERTSGRPFSGRAGRTLFSWLARAGLDEDTARERIYIAAITRCYPGPSPGGRGDRVPGPVERAACADWLDEELRIIRPALIIPVGRLALDRFLGPRPLDELVGGRWRIRHPGGESVCVPLPHPSGASSWIHESGHRALLERAIRRLGAMFRRLGVAAALLLAFTLSAPAAPAQSSERWFGGDKIKHFFMSAFTQSLVYSSLRATNAGHGSSLVGATVASASLGFAKELFDRRARREFSIRDLVWDAAGAGTATLVLSHTRRDGS